MPRSQPLLGETSRFEEPNWTPLAEFAPAHLDHFMWMGEGVLEDGRPSRPTSRR